MCPNTDMFQGPGGQDVNIRILGDTTQPLAATLTSCLNDLHLFLPSGQAYLVFPNPFSKEQ